MALLKDNEDPVKVPPTKEGVVSYIRGLQQLVADGTIDTGWNGWPRRVVQGVTASRTKIWGCECLRFDVDGKKAWGGFRRDSFSLGILLYPDEATPVKRQTIKEARLSTNLVTGFSGVVRAVKGGQTYRHGLYLDLGDAGEIMAGPFDTETLEQGHESPERAVVLGEWADHLSLLKRILKRDTGLRLRLEMIDAEVARLGQNELVEGV